MSDRRLYPNQASFLADIRTAAREHLAVCGTAPTGSGKGDLLAYMTVTALDKLPRRPNGNIGDQRIAITVPFISLVDDMCGRLEKWGVPTEWVGVFQAMHPKYNPGAPVQVCSVDTLTRRNLKPNVDLLLVDECHLLNKWLTAWIIERRSEGKRTVGVSATPWAKGMGKVFTDLVCSLTMREHIDMGLLCDFEVYCAPEKPDLSKLKKVAGDYHQGDLSETMQSAALLADAVSEYRKRLWGKPTIVFAVDRKHARKLQGEYEAAGIPTAYVDCYTKRSERTEIGQKLLTGEVWVVFCVRCLAVGVDWTHIAGIQICRPTVNPMLLVQMLGRGMRVHPGKDKLIILDHGQSIMKLGFPDDLSEVMNEDGLDSGAKGASTSKRKSKSMQPLECSRCGMARKPGIKTCPGCGFAPDPGKLSKVTFADGELVAAKRKAKVKATKDQKQSWYSQLLWIQHTRRRANGQAYSSKWAANVYRAKFGVWPRGLSDDAIPPTDEVLAFVAGQLAAYRSRFTSGLEARP
jgi:superfamily II DNA or RNA helicase